MTITYRGSGAWGAGSGTDLSAAQIDGNVWDHEQRIQTQEARVIPAGIVSFSVSGTEFSVHLSDSSVLGPYDLPLREWTPRGAWAPFTDFLVDDVFYINGTVYLVKFPHTSASTFSAGANDGLGHSYYAELVPNPGNSLPTGGAAGMYLRKNSSTDFDFDPAYIQAVEVRFTPPTGSTLTATNVAAALDELDVLIASITVDALHVAFSPPTGSWLTATNVDDAIDQLSHINAVHVSFSPPTGSSLTATDVAGALVELDGLIGTGSFLPLAGGTMTGAITLSADPASALQPATKQYVDNLVQGLNPKTAVLCATTANITLSGEQTIDGITTSASRVLVKDQSTASQNGIYLSASGSWTRAADMDAWSEVPSAYIFVEEGSTNADTGWVCTSDPGGTLGSTSISWVKFTGGSATSLSSLSDVNVSEGSGISGYVLYWNNSASKWQAEALGTAASHATGDFAQTANNLSDLANAATARGNLGVATGSIEVVIDGGGSVIATGLKGYLSVPFGGTITEAVLLGDRSGSIVVDVWKCTYSQFDAGSTHPVSGDKITASAPPTISSATKSQDSTLTGWTTAFSADDIFAFNVNSASTIQRAVLRLKYTK